MRRPADFKVTGVSPCGTFLESELNTDDVDWEADGTPGVTSGVWCPKCEEWYSERECIHPVDDLGNPIIPSLGDDTPEGEEA
jgi:hypothetical protein